MTYWANLPAAQFTVIAGAAAAIVTALGFLLVKAAARWHLSAHEIWLDTFVILGAMWFTGLWVAADEDFAWWHGLIAAGALPFVAAGVRYLCIRALEQSAKWRVMRRQGGGS